MIVLSMAWLLGGAALISNPSEHLRQYNPKSLILFEFLLVLADPYIDKWSGGAPGIKLLFNAGIAALIFPAHAFFETKLKGRLVKR